MSELQFPTPETYLYNVCHLLDDAARNGMSEQLSGELSAIFTSKSRTDIDLLRFLVCAAGCHSAAKAQREEGLDDGLMLAMGQDLIAKAVDAYSQLIGRLYANQTRQ